MITLSLDPGIGGCGVGLFDDTQLVRASYVKSALTPDNPLSERVRSMALGVLLFVNRAIGIGKRVDRVVYEWPQVYHGGKQEGDPNDLTKLAGVCGALGAFFAEAEVVSFGPRDWKGAVSSNETARRILARLTPEERGRFDDIDKLEAKLALCMAANKQIKETGCKQHNTCDGVGIGLKLLGRFERERVYPR